MTFDELEAKIIKNGTKILSDVSSDFMADVSKAPVVSGDLKTAWNHTPIKNGYEVSNHLAYAMKIWVGKPSAPDTWQVPNGLHPIYAKYKIILINKMKGLDL